MNAETQTERQLHDAGAGLLVTQFKTYTTRHEGNGVCEGGRGI